MTSKRERYSIDNENDTDNSGEGENLTNEKRSFRQSTNKSASDNSDSSDDTCSDQEENPLSEAGKIALLKSSPPNNFSSNELKRSKRIKVSNDEKIEEFPLGANVEKTQELKRDRTDSESVSELFEADDESGMSEKPSDRTHGGGKNKACNNSTQDECILTDPESLFVSGETMGSEKMSGAAVETDSMNTKNNESKMKKLDLAKKKLSKWAARLFDPNRPRELIEAPQIIPLNDEFLQDFGKREKEFFDRVGQPLEIDREKIADFDLVDNDDEEDNGVPKSLAEGIKVKVTNLAYSTPLATLSKKLQEFGAIQEVNLIMDENGKTRNKMLLSIGKAFVTFSDAESAEKCILNLNEKPFDGRVLRVVFANEKKTKRRSTGGNETSANRSNRYWERDISTKCFRCGEVGHLRDQCPNEEKKRPCPLCSTIGHDSWKCPISTHCFNCGIPGHVSRECPYARNLPPRSICGICYQSGHNRWQCHMNPIHIINDEAVCLICGERGHICCNDMKWSFGLNGIFCFNCGLRGHHGTECNRPRFETCNKSAEVTNNEIERAKHWTEANVLASRELDKAFGIKASNHSQQRGRSTGMDNSSFRPRAKSQPPPGRGYRQGHSSNQSRGYPAQQAHTTGQPFPPPSQRGRFHPQQQQHHQKPHGRHRGYR